jgi:hypothetical protein
MQPADAAIEVRAEFFDITSGRKMMCLLLRLMLLLLLRFLLLSSRSFALIRSCIGRCITGLKLLTRRRIYKDDQPALFKGLRFTGLPSPPSSRV